MLRTNLWLIVAVAALVFVHIKSASATLPAGDLNSDFLVNEVDVNLLTGEIAAGTNFPDFDVNLDGLVNPTDLDDWFVCYSSESGVPLATALIDVNFDKVNTIVDYQIIQTNLSLALTDFTSGNLHPDGIIDAADLDLYLSRGGVVPEPSSLLLTTLLLLLGVAGKRR